MKAHCTTYALSYFLLLFCGFKSLRVHAFFVKILKKHGKKRRGVYTKCKTNNCKLVIPEDVIVAKSKESEAKLKSLNKIDDTDLILDIGENTINKIYNIFDESKTI